ncbi:hypothetical protein V3W47_05745 [Deinococcus sp. YIM 134068]|uniref:hypothetical protein n=1 Tax=Deinococcus lichenicola TaxID=3118910 RepID=UPI002F956BF2
MTDDARAVMDGVRGSTEDPPQHAGALEESGGAGTVSAPRSALTPGEVGAASAQPDDTLGNTEAVTADMDAWTTSTEREKEFLTGADEGVTGTNDR